MLHINGLDNAAVNQCMSAVLDCISSVSDCREIRLYHYTSTAVLDSLLSNATFWASNIYYLNDASEFQTGIEALKNAFSKSFGADEVELEECRKICEECIDNIEEWNGYTWPGIFSVSFSIKEDVLNQWITYAKEGGVCIEFDSKIMKGEVKPENYLFITEDSEKNIFSLPTGNIARTIYNDNILNDTEKIKKIIENLVKLCARYSPGRTGKSDMLKKNKEIVCEFFAILASYFKNKDFVIEDEIRMVCPLIFDLDGGSADIFYNKKENGILRPYIKVKFHKGADLDAKAMLPIVAITVGPAGNQEAVFNSVVHRVEYGNPAVWEYDRGYLEKFLLNYVNGCLRQNEIKENGKAVECANYILADWENRTGKKTVSYEEKTLDGEVIQINRVELAGNKKNGEKASLEEQVKQKIDIWKPENYLTKQGIWIKKSKIPYVY